MPGYESVEGTAGPVLPEELRRLLHPRRNANAWTGPAPDPRAAFARMRTHHARNAAVWRRSKSLEDPWAAPLLEKVLQKLEGLEDDLPLPLDPQVEAVLVAVVSLNDSHQDSCLVRAVEYWAGTAGLPFAVEALAASQSVRLMSELQGERVWVTHEHWWIRPGPWAHLRRLLSAAGETEWRAARDVAARLRPEAWLRLRVMLAYLFPDVPEWAAADAREALGSRELSSVVRYLIPSVSDGKLLEEMAHALFSVAGDGSDGSGFLGNALSMLDGAGPAAVPALAWLLGRCYAETREQILDALFAYPCSEVAEALVAHMDARDVLAAVQKLAQAHPHWVLPALAARVAQERRGSANVLLVGQVVRHPALVAELLPSLPEASRGAVEAVLARVSPPGPEAGPEDLPPVLVRPPWTEKKAKKPPRMPDFWEPRAFSQPRLRSGMALPLTAVVHLGTMLALARLDAPDAGIAEVKEACDPASLEAFVWDLFSVWLAMGGSAKEQWAFHALGHLGGDETARRLTPLIRDWPGEGNAARAAKGLDVLAAIGTEVALMILHGLSQKTKSKALQDRARKKIEELAAQRGFTPEELADRLVPDLGLGEDGSMVLDFGPRSFRVGFDEILKPFVRAEGKRLTDLPKPGKGDDPELAARAQAAWKTLKKDVRALASQQILRLELAMCGRRRWEPEVFRTFLLEHPLLQHLVRRLVWGIYDDHESLQGTFRVDEDGSFADVSDEPWHLPEGVRVGLVHSLDLADDLAARWGEVLGDYEILQPFRQLGREVYRIAPDERDVLELRRVEGLQVQTVRVLGLSSSRGWRRGPALDSGCIFWFAKPLPDGLHEARLWLDPGIIAGMVDEEPEQTLGTVIIQRTGSLEDQGVVAFGELSPVVFSELVRDLESLR